MVLGTQLSSGYNNLFGLRIGPDSYDINFLDGTVVFNKDDGIFIEKNLEVFGTSQFWGRIDAFGTVAIDGAFYIQEVITTGAANARLANPGETGFCRLSKSSSSSKRYKNIISEVSVDDIASLYDMPIYWFKYKDKYISSTDERCGKEIPGFVVEDWDPEFPIAVDHNEDGSPEMWNSQIIIPCLLKLIQNNKQLIDSLQNELQQLKENMV